MSFSYKEDYDEYGHPDLNANELLELIRINIQRIFYLLGPYMGKAAIIKRSQNGFHVSFPFSRLTEEEVTWLMEGSPIDSGYRWWVIERGCSTLRTSNKIIVKEVGSNPETKRFVGKRVVYDIPFVVEVLENPWSKKPVPLFMR